MIFVSSEGIAVTSERISGEMQLFLNAFGESVRAYRQERGWSQEELAGRAGIDRTYVGCIERGECNIGIAKVALLAETLGVQGSDLVRRAEALMLDPE